MGQLVYTQFDNMVLFSHYNNKAKIMQSERPELREAVMYAKYSLFITIVSVPFMVMGYILKNNSSFAIDIMSYGIIGFIMGLSTMLFWYRKWRKLRN
jgi:hypothetical protein